MAPGKTDIWMPFYVADYLSDTMHLTPAEHGAYLMLILHYWKSGPIPDDDVRLSIISRLGDAWSNASSTLRAFFKHSDGMLIHTRIEQEKTNAIDNKVRNHKRAVNAASKRWGNDAKSNATSMLQALLDECPSPSPSPIENKEAKASSSTATPPTCPHVEIIELYAQHLPNLPQPKAELWSGARATALRQRWAWLLTAKKKTGERYATDKAEGLDWFSRFFAYVGESDFLTGREGKWSCDLGWLVKADNFSKVVQGNYENKVAA